MELGGSRAWDLALSWTEKKIRMHLAFWIKSTALKADVKKRNVSQKKVSGYGPCVNVLRYLEASY